jgi:hypothetical protein
LLAPWAGDRYWALHEAVGTVTFLGGLAIVYWLIAGLPATKQPLAGRPTKTAAA